MLDFLKRPKPIKSGARALYKRSGEVVVVKEHKMPKQVTIILNKSSKAYQDFRYLPFVQQQFEEDVREFLRKNDIEVTISIDELEVLPDKDIAELLY
jgi:hypothetical protein